MLPTATQFGPGVGAMLKFEYPLQKYDWTDGRVRMFTRRYSVNVTATVELDANADGDAGDADGS